MERYATVDEFLDSLPDNKKSQVLKIRKYILAANPALQEHIKWNAPSYALDGEDRITFNLLNKEGLVKLVFHTGGLRKEDKKGKPIIDDQFSVMEWASDIRGFITFKGLDDATDKEKIVKELVTQWLAIRF